MTIVNYPAEAGGLAPPATVKVWDPFVRVFHWSLVGLFAISFLTGDVIEWLHVWAGYAIATLVASRICWGFVGSGYARFSNFVKGPNAVLTFLKQSLHLEAPRHLGHNPAGGAMIVLLLAMLAGLSGTGFAMTTDAYWGSKIVEEVHEALAYITLVLIGLHMLGVLIASIEHGENLIKAMFTGRKRTE